MTPAQFKPIATRHDLPISWLAKHIGKVSDRTMRYWVNGRPGINVKVPDDVVLRMKRLNRVLDELQFIWRIEDHFKDQVKKLSAALDDDMYKMALGELK